MNSQAFPSGMRFFDVCFMTSIDLRIPGRCVFVIPVAHHTCPDSVLI